MRVPFLSSSIACVLASLFLSLGAAEAFAHGGQFRGPGDGVPPNLRAPTDPTPPPPPTPSGGPTPTSGPSPTPVTPPTGPTAPTTTPPVGTPSLPSTPGRRTTPVTPDDWRFWYHQNKDQLENLKRAIYGLHASGGGIFQHGGEAPTNQDAATRLTQRKVVEMIVPTLLWAMDPTHGLDDDTRSGAYLALAKVTRDVAHVDLIAAAIDREKKQPVLVSGSAALALGMLRRERPEDQLPAKDVDRAREILFQSFEDDEQPTRVRAFAAAAIGLLGDQPTGSGAYAGDRAAAAHATTKHLFDLLDRPWPDADLSISLALAVGLQPPASLDASELDVLTRIAVLGRLSSRRLGELERAYAALALGRIGTSAQIPVLSNLVVARRGVSDSVRRSATIGLGLLARHTDGSGRVELARTLVHAIDRTRDPTTRDFALISLAHVLVAEVGAGSTDVLEGTKATETLLARSDRRASIEQPFASLALGLVAGAVPDELEVDAWQALRERTVQSLRLGLADRSRGPRARAACATALGIARDRGSVKTLVEVLGGRDDDPELRAYAGLAIGLIGVPANEAVRALGEAVRERSSEVLRRECAVGLGLLGNPAIPGTNQNALDLLLHELENARTEAHKAEVVTAIARIGDHRAVDRLVALLRDPHEQDATRAMACVGLGQIGDLEWIPSLARLTKDHNYRASTDFVRELMSVL